MAEGQTRPRRSQRHQTPPERVTEAARQMQQAQENRQQTPPNAHGDFQNGSWPQQGTPYSQQPPVYQQYQQQEEAWQEQFYQQQLYQQQEQNRQRQQAERARVSSATASHGALRGYTGQIPAQGNVSAASASPESTKKKKRGGRAVTVLLLIILTAALAAGGTYFLRQIQEQRAVEQAVAAYDNCFVEGVSVDGIHLGGMTPEQGLNSVQSQIQERNRAWHVTLTYQGTQVAQINAGMLGMSVDVGQIMNDAWAQGHTGTVEERFAAMKALQETPYEAFTATPSGDTSVIDNVLAQVKSQIDVQAVNARLVKFDPNEAYPFSFQEESIGYQLDTDAVREELYHMVATMTSGTVELKPNRIEPEVSVYDLQRHYMLRSSVYTPISTSSEPDRNNNIRRAFEKINGYIVNPGSSFSFNDVVGERTEANGFFPAIEYAYGEHVMGIGGGVCQASTTVYQAAICAGLRVTKRSPHSDSVNYTEYGKDATVYWVGKRKIDLVFKNDTDDPIYMIAAVQKDPSNKRRLIAKVSIYGQDMGDIRYELESKTVQELEPPEKPTYIKDKDATYVTYTDQEKSVSKAKPGYVVESYRVRYEGNIETERTLLYTDTYEPKPERVYVGVSRRPES